MPPVRRRLIGVSRYYMNPQTASAEFAVTISDACQGQGLGQHLMERLIVVAGERGVKQLTGVVLRDNHRMLALAKDPRVPRRTVRRSRRGGRHT